MMMDGVVMFRGYETVFAGPKTSAVNQSAFSATRRRGAAVARNMDRSIVRDLFAQAPRHQLPASWRAMTKR
jgi:hypothetical protein